MDLSYFEEPTEVLIAEATYDEEGIEISPDVYETQQQRKQRPSVLISMDKVERLIAKHGGADNRAVRANLAVALPTLQWEWLDKWEAWKAKDDEDTAWNAEFVDTVSHVVTVRVVDDPETGEFHLEDQEVLHVARELSPEPLRPPVQSVDEWLEVRYPAATLEEVKADRRAYINSQRDVAMMAGVEYNGNVYDSDFVSQSNLTRVHTGVNDSWALPANFTWRTADNQDIPFTVEDINNLAHIMLDTGNSIYNKSWTLKKNVDDATTPEEVNSIVW